jgi:F0F1-type ATP synthase assembly protein I
LASSSNPYLRLSAAAIQMAAVIGGFSWLGSFLDSKYHTTNSLWTIILGLLGVGIGLYIVIKEVLANSKEK